MSSMAFFNERTTPATIPTSCASLGYEQSYGRSDSDSFATLFSSFLPRGVTCIFKHRINLKLYIHIAIHLFFIARDTCLYLPFLFSRFFPPHQTCPCTLVTVFCCRHYMHNFHHRSCPCAADMIILHALFKSCLGLSEQPACEMIDLGKVDACYPRSSEIHVLSSNLQKNKEKRHVVIKLIYHRYKPA
jgi:hypothetical protein